MGIADRPFSKIEFFANSEQGHQKPKQHQEAGDSDLRRHRYELIVRYPARGYLSVDSIKELIVARTHPQKRMSDKELQTSRIKVHPIQAINFVWIVEAGDHTYSTRSPHDE